MAWTFPAGTLFGVRRARPVAPARREPPANLMPDHSIVNSLMAVIAERKSRPPAKRSYVASLLEGGVTAIGAKVVEEAAEVVEAAGEAGDAGREHLVKEVADLVFHALVMLAHRDADWSQVEAELGRRFGISGIDEKAARQPPVGGSEAAPMT